MRELKYIGRFLQYLLGAVFAVFATAAFNVIAPDSEQQLAVSSVLLAALATILGVVFLTNKYWPEFFRRYRAFVQLRRDSRFSVPNGLTASRAVIAGFVVIALISNESETAYWFYVSGLVTDILDGMVARSIDSATDWGKRFDAQVDILFNGATGVILFWFGIRHGHLWIVVSAALLFALFIVRLFWGSQGLLPKYFSGLVRLVFLALFIGILPAPVRGNAILVGAGVVAFGAWYEHRVMLASVSDPPVPGAIAAAEKEESATPQERSG